MSEWLEYVDDQRDSLPQVPEITCPLIDECVHAILMVEKLCNPYSRPNRFSRQEHGSLGELADAVESELSGITAKLEKIRKHNSTLRELGEQWHDIAKRIAVEVDASVGKVEDLTPEVGEENSNLVAANC